MKRKLAYLCYRLTTRWSWLWSVRLRRPILNAMLGRKHKGLWVFEDVQISAFRKLTLGDSVSVQHGCDLTCEGGLTVGDNVAIGHGTSIVTTEHGFDDPDTPIKYQPLAFKPVVISDNVWIGANLTILAGVRIASGTVIAAGAVVTRSIETHDTIVGGVPARFIKSRLMGDRQGIDRIAND